MDGKNCLSLKQNIQKIELKTNDIVTVFWFDELNRGNNDIAVKLEVNTTENAQNWPLRSIESRFSAMDIYRLISYFKTHIQGLEEGSICESPVFVPSELAFQLRALDGDVETLLDGRFTIELLFNYGLTTDGCNKLYLGYSSSIELQDVHEFCALAERVVENLSKLE